MLTWKDAVATVTTAVVVAVFAASHQGWAVPLVGHSHRWAAAAVLVIGSATCGLGNPDSGANRLFAVLGVAAFAFGAAAIVSGSLTALSLQVADTVAMWAIATVRHASAGGRHPSTAT